MRVGGVGPLPPREPVLLTLGEVERLEKWCATMRFFGLDFRGIVPLIERAVPELKKARQ